MQPLGLARESSTVAALAVLAACAPRPHDVAWYRAHADARAQALADCRNDQARQPSTACASALRADAEAVSQAAWSFAPPHSRLKNPGKL